jgi:hypothetical protein
LFWAFGSVDVIGFLGLDGLFTAHITGNLVVLAAHIVARGEASLALVISVPLFIIVLAATRVLAAGLERGGIPSLGVLLFVQFALLCGFLGTCIAAGPGVSASAPSMILAGMLGVSAMAVQNALVISLVGAPYTDHSHIVIHHLAKGLHAGSQSKQLEARRNVSQRLDLQSSRRNGSEYSRSIHGVAFLCGISTPSLSAQGEQRRSAFFNIRREYVMQS